MTSLFNSLRQINILPLQRNVTYSASKVYSQKNKIFVREILMKYLGINKKSVVSLMKGEAKIYELTEDHVKEISEILKTNNVDFREIERYSKVLYTRSSLLKHRIFLLQELGVENVDARILANFTQFINLSPAIFKAYTNISDDLILIENIYSHLQSAPDSPPKIDDTLNVNQFCQFSLKHYLAWKLGIEQQDKEEFEKLTLQHRSFRLFEDVILTLTNDFKFSNNMIKKNVKLIDSSSDISTIYNKLQSVTSDATSMIIRCPQLLNRNIKDVSEIINYIKEVGIPSDYIKKWPEALNFTAAEFKRRMESLLSHSELKMFIKHPRFLKLICHFRIVDIRLKYMKEFTYRRSSLTLLTGNHRLFKNSINHERNKISLNELVTLLNKDFQMDEAQLKKQIKKHPYWKYTSLMQVKKTFDYLKQHFSIEDIYKNLYAIFYPSDKINNVLQDLKNQYSNAGSSSCAPTQLLALCIYKMELDHNFTGDGIWTQENQKNQDYISKVWKNKEPKIENLDSHYLAS